MMLECNNRVDGAVSMTRTRAEHNGNMYKAGVDAQSVFMRIDQPNRAAEITHELCKVKNKADVFVSSAQDEILAGM